MPAEEGTVSLLERARAVKSARRSTCTLAKLLTAHPDLGINELLANSGDGHGEGIPYSVAASVISEAVGQKIDGQTLSRHQRGRCACS